MVSVHTAPWIDEDLARAGTEPPVLLLRKDLRKAAQTLSTKEVRYLVDTYYQWQDFRMATANQIRSLTASGEPSEAIRWTQERMVSLEDDVRAMLDTYTRTEPTGMGQWARAIVGIGPVIAAGLCAHLDITRAPTVGHWWRFAGLDPTTEWKKGEKRPWNAGLKVLAYKVGESFVKVQNNKRDIYGTLFVQRKAFEQARNERGDLAEQAAAKLERFKIDKSTDAYKAYSIGKLPPAHIHARARRWTVKLFLAHYWEESYVRHHGKPPPLPYPLVYLGHAHKIGPPNPSSPLLDKGGEGGGD